MHMLELMKLPTICKAVVSTGQLHKGLFKARGVQRERERHYIFSSHLRADQMCRGSFLGTHQ